MRLFWILILVLQSSLFADAPTISATLDTDPSLRITGIINQANGEYILAEYDLVIAGKQPIEVPRFYSRTEEPEKSYEIFPHLKIFKQGSYVHIKEPNGTEVRYLRGSPSLYNTGYANTSRGHISARTNLYNQTTKGCCKKKLTLKTCDGGKRIYVGRLLRREILPNGNQILYDYNDAKKVTKVTTTSPSGNLIYATLDIEYKKDKIKLSGSDGQRLTYHFNGDLIEKIERSHHPDETITYEERKITQRKSGKNKQLNLTYGEWNATRFYIDNIKAGSLLLYHLETAVSFRWRLSIKIRYRRYLGSQFPCHR